MASKVCKWWICRRPDGWDQVRIKGSVVCHFVINPRFINKASESYLSATLSTTERHFGFKTKEMSLVRYKLKLYLALTGAQGVTMSVCLSVINCHIVHKNTQSSSLAQRAISTVVFPKQGDLGVHTLSCDMKSDIIIPGYRRQ